MDGTPGDNAATKDIRIRRTAALKPAED